MLLRARSFTTVRSRFRLHCSSGRAGICRKRFHLMESFSILLIL
jgi:hypothetical protein